MSVSSSASVFSSLDGTMRSDRFGLPQEIRNFWTSSSVLTACKISSFVSVPESSLSIMMKTSRAAFKKPALNSSSAAAAARSRRSRSSASCARRFLRPRWIASSPVCASSHVADVSKTQNSTFLDVDLAGIVRVELLERMIQTLRFQQKL